jgi:hypothetical protein
LALLSGLPFRRARALHNPHEYVVRGKSMDTNDFSRLVQIVRRLGVKRGWGGKTYIVWYAPDGFHYWTMGWPVAETTILNRARSADEDQTYDAKPTQRYSGPDGRAPEFFSG